MTPDAHHILRIPQDEIGGHYWIDESIARVHAALQQTKCENRTV